MKTNLKGGLLLFGLAGGQSHASNVAPSCVVDCTKNMANQTALEGMRAACHNVATQRALFHCLLNACSSKSYGYALGYTISACSDLGAGISPLHPIEVHHVAPVKRQNIPTEPGPVLPSPSNLHSGQVLTFDHKFAVALDCNAGADGLVTLSVSGLDSAATPSSGSNGGSPNHGDSDRLGNNAAQGDPARQSQNPHQQGPDGINTYVEHPDCDPTATSARSRTVAAAQRTGCPCESSSSSTSTSATLFQSPAGQQSGSLPLSTTTLSSSWFPGQTSHAQTETCEDASLLANSTTTTTSHTRTSSLLGPATQGPGPLSSTDCSEFAAASVSTPPTTSATTTLTTSSTSSWSTSTLTSSLPSTTEDPCTNSSSIYTTTSSTSTRSSSWYSTTTTSTSTSCTEEPTSSKSTTQRSSTSTTTDVTDCAESSTSVSRTQDTSATASLHEASTNVTSVSSTQSSWRTASTSLSTSLILTTGPPAYTTLAPPTPPAYLPPLAQYSYGNPPMYSSLSVSMPTSSVPGRSSTSIQTTGPGVFGSQDTTTTSSTLYLESYAPSSSTLGGPAPTRTQMPAEPVDGFPFGLSAVPDNNSVGGKGDSMDNGPSESSAAQTLESLVDEGSPIGTRSDLAGASAAPPAQATEGTTAYDEANNAVLVTIISPDVNGEVRTTIMSVHENAPWATTAPRDNLKSGPDTPGKGAPASSRNDLLFALANSETGDQGRWPGPVPETTFVAPGPDMTGTFVRSDHTVSEMEATPTVVTAGSNGLRSSLSLVCAAILAAVLGVITTTVN